MEQLETFLQDYGGVAFPFPEIAGKYRGKRLVVCGDGACIWDDLERLGCRRDGGNARRGSVAGDFDFLTVNKAVETFPGNIEHAYSNEPSLLNAFVAARRNEYRTEFEGPKHTHSMRHGCKWHWPLGGHGTSGLGAVLVGFGLGYEQVILCGMPLDDGPHNGEPPWRQCRFSREAADTREGNMNAHWKRAKDAFGSRLKSMSGRTKDWLGAP